MLRGDLPASVALSVAPFTAAVGDCVAHLARALVQHTVSLSIARQREARRAVGVPLSVLNRRRRAARAWLEAVVAARVDRETQHAVAHHWLPQLIGCGPELHTGAKAGRELIEFVRGLLVGRIFDAPGDNLMPEAHALHVAETVLAVHLGGWKAAVERSRTRAAARG